MKNIFLMTFLLSSFLLSCEDVANDPIDEAWALYESGDYIGSYDAFETLVSERGAQAIEGQAWSALALDDLTKADELFSEIATDSLPDAYAGWLVVGWTKKQYNDVIDRTNVVLTINPEYEFTHNVRFDYKDINVHLAFSMFHVGDLNGCNSTITYLDNSWTSTTNTDAILVKLESLYNTFK